MKVVRLAWLIILGHVIIATVHGMAHMQLGIALSLRQSAYVLLVITLAPILAAVLLWLRRVRSGFLIMTLSLAGALLFGVYWHFVAESPDNVFHLKEGTLPSIFCLTAFLLALSEASGVAVGLWGLLKEQYS